MTDLVEFINARLNEDEAAAHAAAAGGRWRYEDGDSVGAWTLYDEHWNIATLTTYEHSTYDYATRMPAARNPRYVAADANGRHIARHDPARVLREVEAKRRLLAFLLDIEGRELGGEWWQINQRHAAPIQLLAMSWSDHPDYRSEWSPS